MLTKEEYLEILKCEKKYACSGCIIKLTGDCSGCKAYVNFKAIEELINEHFDNNMARTCQNLVSEIDKLEKALDKACEELTADTLLFKSLNFTKGIKKDNYSKEQWKEWLLEE